MPYSALQDQINAVGSNRILQWTDDAGTGSIDTAIVNAAIQNADDKINAHLSQRFAAWLPFTSAMLPPIVMQLSIGLTQWNLATRMQEVGEVWITKHNEDIALLEDIANGMIDLVAKTGENLTALTAKGSAGTRHVAISTPDQDDLVMPSALLAYRRRNPGAWIL